MIISCRFGIGDAEWAQLRALKVAGMTVVEIARVCKCRSRCVVYKALANDVPPSQRRRSATARKSRKKITTRQSRVKSLIQRTRVVTATKIKKARGRPRKDGTPRSTYKETKQIRKLVYPSPAAVARCLTNQGFPVSRTTVRRDLAAVGMKAYSRPKVPALTKGQMTARVKLCKRLLRNPSKFWPRLVFSDEKWFDCNDAGVRYQYCEVGKQKEQILGREQSQSGPKVFVWGAISMTWRILVFVEYAGKGMNQFEYVEQCISKLKKKQVRNLIFMQDGARVHWTPFVRKAIEKTGIEILNGWVPNSCDMNPIESLWNRVQTAVSERAPFGAEELRAFVKDEFFAIPQQSIAKHVLSFKNVCVNVVKSEGRALQ